MLHILLGCCLNKDLMRGQGEVGSEGWKKAERARKWVGQREMEVGITLQLNGEWEGFSFTILFSGGMMGQGSPQKQGQHPLSDQYFWSQTVENVKHIDDEDLSNMLPQDWCLQESLQEKGLSFELLGFSWDIAVGTAPLSPLISHFHLHQNKLIGNENLPYTSWLGPFRVY